MDEFTIRRLVRGLANATTNTSKERKESEIYGIIRSGDYQQALLFSKWLCDFDWKIPRDVSTRLNDEIVRLRKAKKIP